MLEKENGQLKKCMNGGGNVGHENYSHFNHPIHGLISGGGNGNMVNGKNINNVMGMKWMLSNLE